MAYCKFPYCSPKQCLHPFTCQKPTIYLVHIRSVKYNSLSKQKWCFNNPSYIGAFRILMNSGDYMNEGIEVMERLPELKEEEPKEEDKSNVVPLRLLTGGKEPPGSSSKDWLTPLTENTSFLVQRINNKTGLEFELLEYRIVFKAERSIALSLTYNHEIADIWVDPKLFCKLHTLVEVLEVGE